MASASSLMRGKIHVGLHLRVAQDAHGGLGDVHGLVADALEVAIDARDGEEKAQVGGHGLLSGEQALDALVNFDLHFVDGVFFGEDDFGEMFFGIQNGVHGLMDGALGEAAHPEQSLLQFFEIVFEMSFHGSSISDSAAKLRARIAAGPAATTTARTHPKRPVM